MAFSSQSFAAPSIPKFNRRNISSPFSSSASKISGATPTLKRSRIKFKSQGTSSPITASQSSIVNTLAETNTILVEIQSQLAYDFAMRIAEEKERNKVLKSDKSRRRLALKEGAIESTRKIGTIVKSATGKILAPVKGVFDKIIEFLSLIATGIAANTTLEWLKNDENIQKLTGWFNFIVEHWKWGLAALGAVAALNLVGPISGLVTVLKVATGLLVGGIKPLLALLVSKAFLAAAGIALGIGGTLFGMKAGIDAGKRYGAGGQAHLDAFDALKDELNKAGITVKGSGKKEKFYLSGTGKGAGDRGQKSASGGTDEQKALIESYKKRRDALIDNKDAMKAEISKQRDAVKAVMIKRKTTQRERQRGAGATKTVEDRQATEKLRNEAESKVRAQFEGNIQGILEARRLGGPVSPGKPYLVGEDGPEIVVPKISGTVINNTKTKKIYETISSKNAGKINFVTMDLPPQVMKTEKSIPTPPAPPVPNISSTNAADLWRNKTPDIYGIYV